MHKVVVTGGTGFIGFRLVMELLEHNVEVIVLTRNSDALQFSELRNARLLRFIEYHTDNFGMLKENKEEIDAFYHLAWAGVSNSQKNDPQIQLANISFSMEMLEYAKEIGAKRFLGIGTVAEYAFGENLIEANTVTQTPNDMYGAAKTSAHYMLETYAKLLDIPFNWVVCPSTFGEGRRDDNIITYTIVSLLNERVPRYGMLTQMWDFLYVGEVARELRLIGEKGCYGKTYGIGSGIYRQLKDYIVKIRDIINPDLMLGIGEIPSMSEKAVSSCVNIYELVKDTGFEPKVSFEEGIERTISFYKHRNQA